MRNLEINKRTFYACRYKSTVDVLDTNGYRTGEKKVTYYPKQEFKAHISGARGRVTVAIFGSDVQYDKTIVLTKKEFNSLE